MTGTGTKADPYIIFTWDELLSTIVQSDVYIEFGADIDCKELGAVTVEGDSSGYAPYPINCTELDGKGFAIKNLYLYNGAIPFGNTKGTATIKNLDFINLYIYHTGLFKFRCDHPLYYHSPTFKNCRWSVELVDSSLIGYICTSSYAPVFRDCTFFILCHDGQFIDGISQTDNRCPCLLDNCVVEIYGTVYKRIMSAQLINSYIFGEVTLSYYTNSAYCLTVQNVGVTGYYTNEFLNANSIIDLIIHNDTGQTPDILIDGNSYTDFGETHYVTQSLFINTEVIDNLIIDASKPYQSCTSAQIHDETYLRSNGFIAEEIWDNRYVRKHSLICAHYGDSPSEPKAYIDTGIKNESNIRIQCEFELSQPLHSYAMGGINSSGYGLAIGSGDGEAMDWLDSYTVNVRGYSYGFAGTKFSCYAAGTTSWAQQSEVPMIINGYNDGASGTGLWGIDGDIYHISIWNTDWTLARDYYPAYDTVNHEYGMYDKVAQTFHGSDTDTSFDSGDEMPFKFIEGKLVHNKEIEVLKLGAFCNDNSLSLVSIPRSVKKIGRFSFRNTSLTSVMIADDCECYDTSFPENCTINYYD